MFSHPPLATVGLTEPQAEAKYGKENLKVYRARFTNLCYATYQMEIDEKPKTVMKLICLRPELKVVGLHVMGQGADEMMQVHTTTIVSGT